MQGPPALGVRPAGDAEVAHYPEHFGKERNDVDTHQRSSGQSLSMRRAARSTERMCARTNGTSISAGLPLALRMASGPSAPSLWHRTFSTAWAPLSNLVHHADQRGFAIGVGIQRAAYQVDPVVFVFFGRGEGPARGLHGKSAQGFGQIAIGNARQLRHDRGALGTDCRTLYATGPDATTPRADSGTGRVNHHSEAVSSTSACAECGCTLTQPLMP